MHAVLWKHPGRFPAVLVSTTLTGRSEWHSKMGPGHKTEITSDRNKGNGRGRRAGEDFEMKFSKE